jgi:UDPglucose--hexose-1-phosphate uridylyltransferase
MGRIPRHPLIEKHFTHPPEWRMNPVTGQLVIVAPERAGRPMPDEIVVPPPPLAEPCPFCPGNEEQTPGELEAFRAANSSPNAPGWRVRTVPNAFAAVKKAPGCELHGDHFFNRAFAGGRHELIIECAQHETNLSWLTVEQVREVVRMWRERMFDASRDPTLRYAQLFKNHGPEAGASVEHAHSQMIATPMIPAAMRDELAFAAKFHRENGVCAYCELLRREAADGSREVMAAPEFTAIAAYAARQPFETWIVPNSHQSQFELTSPPQADELGTVLWTILRKMATALQDPAYNLVFHTAPFHEAPSPSYHWHVEVLPRLSQLAGFELGTGSHVTPILPEDAAVILRETD